MLDRPGAATPGLRESPEDQFKRALAAAVSRAEGDQLAGIIKKSTDSFVAISKSATDNALALNVAATRTMTVRLGMALSGTIVLLGLAAGVFTTASFMIVLPMISGGLATLWGALAIGARNAAETKALLAFFASRSAAVETQIKSGND